MSSQETTLCHSIKNKNDYTQCPRKCKGESKFCGIHLKMNNPTIYDQNMNITMVIKCNNLNIKPIKNKNNNKNKKNKIIKQKKYTGFELEQIMKVMSTCNFYSDSILLDKRIPISIFKVRKIRNTLIKNKLHKLIDIKKGKRELLNEYISYTERMKNFKINNLNEIIKIQAIARGYITRRMFNTVNTEDFYTCCTKYEIPKQYYFSFYDKKLQYFFDIRSLYKLYIMAVNNGKSFKNPYNMQEISLDVISQMLHRISIIDASNEYDIEFKNNDNEQSYNIESIVSNLFNELDRLDNYTDYKWFMDLEMKQLKKLYENTADLWYFRTSMTLAQRCQIVSNGRVFNKSLQTIYNLGSHQKDDLRIIIVNDFMKMITEGITIDDRKLGAILVLTALTTVSRDACLAMPQYVQDF